MTPCTIEHTNCEVRSFQSRVARRQTSWIFRHPVDTDSSKSHVLPLDGSFPTVGAWVNYGLGSLNDNLPRFVNMGPRFSDRRDGHYLGPAYDAVPLKVDPANPLPYAKPELDLTQREQELEFGLINRLNQLNAFTYPNAPPYKLGSSPTNLATACNPRSQS